jgi:septal ring factor EnvC (AmiA/AmiB activator)
VVEQTQRETEKQQLLGEIEERDRQLAKVQEKLQKKSERVMELATRLGQRDDTIEKLRSKLRKTKSQLADAQQELERFRAFAQTMPVQFLTLSLFAAYCAVIKRVSTNEHSKIKLLSPRFSQHPVNQKEDRPFNSIFPILTAESLYSRAAPPRRSSHSLR